MAKEKISFNEQLGRRMIVLRKRAGYSNAEKFAFAKDLGRSQYGKYEAGKTSITSNVLKRVIDALGVTVSEFFSEGFDD